MRRINRSVSIFTLSALDVLAMATGVFVLLAVFLMPYYRKTFDAGAKIQDIAVAAAELQSDVNEMKRETAELLNVAVTAETEAEQLDAAAADLRAAAETLRQNAAASHGNGRTRDASPRTMGETTVTQAMDLVFVVDASGSMRQVLRDLGASLADIVQILGRLVPSLRVGLVAYRDYDVGPWVVRGLPLQSTSTQLMSILNHAAGLRAASVGGSSVTEAVHAGLDRSVRMAFRSEAKQVIIVIGDAAAHPNEHGQTLALAQAFKASGRNRTISTLFVPTTSYRRYGQGDREFFVALARTGGGTFNDHRGEMLESVLLSIFEN